MFIKVFYVVLCWWGLFCLLRTPRYTRVVCHSKWKTSCELTRECSPRVLYVIMVTALIIRIHGKFKGETERRLKNTNVFFSFLIMYLFGFWLGWVFVAASGLSLVVVGGGLLCRGAQALGALLHGLWWSWHTCFSCLGHVASSLTRDRNHVPGIGGQIPIPWTTRELQPVLFYFQKNPKIKLSIFTLLNSPWPVGRQRGFYIRRKWSKVSSLTFCPLEPHDEGITRREENIRMCHCSGRGPCKQGCFRKSWACDEGIFPPFQCHFISGDQATAFPRGSHPWTCDTRPCQVKGKSCPSPSPLRWVSGLPSIREEESGFPAHSPTSQGVSEPRMVEHHE